MNYRGLQKTVLAKFDKDIDDLGEDTKVLDLVKQQINDILEIIYDFTMPWMKRESIISIKAKYSTGTITATNGSMTITGAGTTFLRNMKGQKIVISDGTDGTVVYRINGYTDATHLTLDTPYIHTGGALLTYTIYYDTYTLDKDFKTMNEIKYVTIAPYDSTNMLASGSSSTPNQMSFMGVTVEPYYNTGTVTTTANSTAVVGDGTDWDSTMAGKYIVIGNYGKWFKIASVTDATNLVLDSAYPEAGPGTSYQIDPPGLQQVRFTSGPTVVYLKPYTFWPKGPKLYSDNDISPVPSDSVVILGVIWLNQKANELQSQIQTKNDFDKKLARMALIKINEEQTNVFPQQG
jgi:hypothetical protein